MFFFQREKRQNTKEYNMIVGILVGRGGSVGLPKKNITPVLGRPLMCYPLLAAKNSKYIDELFLSTESEDLAKIGKEYGASIINRPAELATSDSTLEDVFFHALHSIKKQRNEKIEFIVLLMCNAVSVLPKTIDNGIEILRSKKQFDSAVTVTGFNMFTPVRARKIDKDGSLVPFVPLDQFNFKIDSNRQKQDTVYFHDCGASVVRPKCLERVAEGLLPQKWMGQKIYPLTQEGVLDVDYDYELQIAENWLLKNGFTDKKLPYDLREKK
jgi:CMP-N-acetylneuraminic acid synthetase